MPRALHLITMKAVILAGGEATRLRPLTCNTPKVMVPILNRPFLEHLVGYLKRHGIPDIILALGKVPEQIESHFGDGARFGVRMVYSTEESPLGTAGAVKNAERLMDDSFFVFNGDVFTDIDLTAMLRHHRRSDTIATIALTPVDNPTIYGVVETDSQGSVKRFTEKPSPDKVATNMINAGIYILEPEIFTHISPNAFSMFERDVFPPLLDGGHTIHSYPSHEYWIDMGTPDKYLRLQHDLLRSRPPDRAIEFEGESRAHPSARIEGPVTVGEGCAIGAHALLRGPAVIGAGCQVEEDAEIEGAVLWRDCTVGRGARLRNCLVASRCHIEQQSEVIDGCVLGDDVWIRQGNRLPAATKIWPGREIATGTISF